MQKITTTTPEHLGALQDKTAIQCIQSTRTACHTHSLYSVSALLHPLSVGPARVPVLHPGVSDDEHHPRVVQRHGLIGVAAAVDQQSGSFEGEGRHELIHDAAGNVHEVVVGPLAPDICFACFGRVDRSATHKQAFFFFVIELYIHTRSAKCGEVDSRELPLSDNNYPEVSTIKRDVKPCVRPPEGLYNMVASLFDTSQDPGEGVVESIHPRCPYWPLDTVDKVSL